MAKTDSPVAATPTSPPALADLSAKPIEESGKKRATKASRPPKPVTKKRATKASRPPTPKPALRSAKLPAVAANSPTCTAKLFGADECQCFKCAKARLS